MKTKRLPQWHEGTHKRKQIQAWLLARNEWHGKLKRLANKFRCSVETIRSAIRDLEAQGLIRVKLHKAGVHSRWHIFLVEGEADG